MASSLEALTVLRGISEEASWEERNFIYILKNKKKGSRRRRGGGAGRCFPGRRKQSLEEERNFLLQEIWLSVPQESVMDSQWSDSLMVGFW